MATENGNLHARGTNGYPDAPNPAHSGLAGDVKLDDQSPVEQVALTVPTTDDPDVPVWTFRVWFLGLLCSGILSFLNQFFDYHTEPLFVTPVTVQILSLPIGHLMAAWLPKERFRLPFTRWTFTLNPGKFNIKEHVLITLFSNGGGYYAGGGTAYAVYIFSVVRAFYHRQMSFVPALLLVVCTQMLGYGWAGLYLVEPAHMWEIRQRSKSSFAGKPDVHTKLMKRYAESWFQVILILTTALAILATVVFKSTLQMPFWAVLLAVVLSASFTLAFGVLQATNTSPGLNVLSEYLIGCWLPNQPLTNMCFKAYSTISVAHALSFLQDMKLGHYMKIPPKALFFVQASSTIICAIINLGVATWLLDSVEGICDPDYARLHPEFPWTCPLENVFFPASVIWGLVGPRLILGPDGFYRSLNWGFLIGFLLPLPVYLAHRKWPKQQWLKHAIIPVVLNGMGAIPPAGVVNMLSWVLVGTIFTFYMFRYKEWWSRYNYVLSAGLDAGTAFFQILIYFCLNFGHIKFTWWGSGTSVTGDHCPLAQCPTNPAIQVDNCPIRL